jgi:glycosyltransferase involved in cell wall biosynthesis
MFDPNDFDYSEKKDDYFLFIGRIITNKGVMIAKDACEAIGAKLKVAGIDNGLEIEGKNVEMVGFADANKRRELISKAKAVFVPTLYLEPFGYVIIEAAFSGTPVITTDFGAFVENVQQGKTGYRCRTFVDFIEAAKNIDKINPKDCRDWAMGYTLEKVAPMYQDYFEQLQNLFGRGWYSRL